MDYSKLNEIIKKSLTDYTIKYQVDYFDEIVKLAIIIIKNTDDLDKKDYQFNVDLNTSIEITTNFFKNLNSKYADMFLNILNETNTYDKKEDYSVRFYKLLKENQPDEYVGQHRNKNSFVDINGQVHIDYSETLEDVFTIAHEMTHKFSQPKNQNSLIKSFLGEVTTISVELLLEDYLYQNTNYGEEILNYKNNRIIDTFDDASAIIFENILVKLYLKNNEKLDENILIDFLNLMDKNSKLYRLFLKRGLSYLNEIMKSGSLQFYKRQRYVIGLVLASYIHDKIKNNPENKNILCHLIEILGNSDINMLKDLELLEKLDIPIIKNNQISIDEDKINLLSETYRKEINNILSNQKVK